MLVNPASALTVRSSRPTPNAPSVRPASDRPREQLDSVHMATLNAGTALARVGPKGAAAMGLGLSALMLVAGLSPGPAILAPLLLGAVAASAQAGQAIMERGPDAVMQAIERGANFTPAREGALAIAIATGAVTGTLATLAGGPVEAAGSMVATVAATMYFSLKAIRAQSLVGSRAIMLSGKAAPDRWWTWGSRPMSPSPGA